jgi:hypothetical protein
MANRYIPSKRKRVPKDQRITRKPLSELPEALDPPRSSGDMVLFNDRMVKLTEGGVKLPL